MNNEITLVNNISEYYSKSCSVLNEFGGPSIYFHVQAIKEQKHNFMSDRHIEMIYATLASWGMHRMGDPKKTKAKMVDYDPFWKSLINHQRIFSEYLNLKMESCSEEEYSDFLDVIKTIFLSLKVSISKSILVGHSKALAHVLPDLVPPMDRQYTIRFFTQDNQEFFTSSGNYKAVPFPSDHLDQYLAFKEYSLRMKQILDRCDKDQFEINPNTFNTSYPKIIDNVIMAFVKNVPKPVVSYPPLQPTR